MEQVILVDSNDQELGLEEKFTCHKHPAKLHRAFSIFIFNEKGQLLITKRNKEKKTWPGFWSNAVCSHPRKGEHPEHAADRRLMEELGIKSELKYLFKFIYSANFDGEWGEHELDWVFVGKTGNNLTPNKSEIDDWKFVDVKELEKDIKKNPDNYTPWFKIALPRVLKHKDL